MLSRVTKDSASLTKVFSDPYRLRKIDPASLKSSVSVPVPFRERYSIAILRRFETDSAKSSLGFLDDLIEGHL